MKDAEIAWLAGLLEGEGSFVAASPSHPKGARILNEMVDLDVIERVSKLVGLGYTQPNLRKEHWRKSYKIIIRGPKVVEVVRAVYPFMSVRRRAQIVRALTSVGLAA